MYQVEGKIWALVHILSSKLTHISVKKVQTLQSTMLSRIHVYYSLLTMKTINVLKIATRNMMLRAVDRTHDDVCMWVISAVWWPFRRLVSQLADQRAARNDCFLATLFKT